MLNRMLFVPLLLVVGMGATCTQQEIAPTGLKTAMVSDAGTATAPSSYADVVSRVAPAVVTVRSERHTRAPQQYPFLDDPMLREFFGRQFDEGGQQPRERVQRGLGSGVTLHANRPHQYSRRPQLRARFGTRPRLVVRALG